MPNTEQSIEETGGVPVIEMEMEVSGMTMYPTDKTLSVADMPADAKEAGDAIREASNSIADILLDIQELDGKTGADIPLNDVPSALTIAQAIDSLMADMYPVGSLYVSSMETLPASIARIGEWVEVAIPLKHGDKLYGTRNYVEVDTGFVAGNLHFWLRTE